ncbi:MAG: L,D-transpeptidase catalytic domain [Crocinitomicaceae bacterium]|jgi:murein L,D-transpeptidase YafK|nr:L,D-transpeptidase catalytic domain [Crocinitomicaceae bacterium]
MTFKRIYIPLLVIAVVGLAVSAFQFKTESKAQGKSLREIVQERKIPGKSLKIYVKKKKRTLSVFYKDSCLITYPCVLGFAPDGDKMQEGDGKTPEGKFGIKSMYPHKSWTYFIWFDYPNATSRERFEKRKKDGTIPKNARIGGEVGIHGVPEGSDSAIDEKQDWTLGCISLKNSDITDLYKSISTETKIEIVP